MSKKFDVVIGNPPYQEEVGRSENQRQSNTKWIYQHFQRGAEEISDITCMIYPFGGWFDNPRAMQQFGEGVLTDGHTKQIHAYEGSVDKRAWYREDKQPDPLFGKDIDISAGVSIVYRDLGDIGESYLYSNRVYSDYVRNIQFSEGILTSPSPNFTFDSKLHGDKLISILNKNPFKIESNFVELNPDAVSHCIDGVDNPIQLLTNDKAGPGGRATMFYCERDLITDSVNLIDSYKVIMTSAYPKQKLTSGIPNVDNVKKRISELVEVLPPGSVFGRSRMMLFGSNNKLEIDNFMSYISTNFFAYLVLQEPNRRSSIGQVIPLQDFTEDSDIDWSKSIAEIDQQLYEKYNLNEEEINFIETNVKEMD